MELLLENNKLCIRYNVSIPIFMLVTGLVLNIIAYIGLDEDITLFEKHLFAVVVLFFAILCIVLSQILNVYIFFSFLNVGYHDCINSIKFL